MMKNLLSYFLYLLCLSPLMMFANTANAQSNTYFWYVTSASIDGSASCRSYVPSFSDMITCLISRTHYQGRVTYLGMEYAGSGQASGYMYFQVENPCCSGPVKTSATWTRVGSQCPAGQSYDSATLQCRGKPKDSGVPESCNKTTGNPINIGLGNKLQQEFDYKSNSNSLSLLRTYNSNGLNRASRWGTNWIDNYNRSILYGLTNTTAQAIRPDGKVYAYSLTNNVWLSDGDVPDQLTQQINSAGTVVGWTYRVARDNSVEIYNAAGQLLSLTNRSGQTQTLTYSDGTAGINGGYVLTASGTPTTTKLPRALLIRITDTFSRQLLLGYDSLGRVVKVTDPTGGIYLYTYNTAGNLTSAKYPDSKIRTYVYNESVNTSGSNLPNALTGIIDENNNRFATWKYDAQGRAISSEHNLTNGNPVEKVSIVYSTDASRNVTSSAVTDALSTTRTYSFSNILGVAKNTGVTQPCSSGCGTNSATTYDINGNVASKTDFNGNITNYVYDLTRNLETSRTEAYGTTKARTTTTEWHTTYSLPTLITESGKTTLFTHDANGNVLTKTITDTTLNKSHTWTYTYNTLGQVLTADGPRTDVSDVTTYTYYPSASSTPGSVHSLGDLATVTNAAGQVTSITNYDLNGRPLSITDSNGVVTALEYWPRGWLKKRTVNGVQITSYDYDGVGQLTKVTLPDSSYLNYTYDTAHRLTDITDNAGNTVHYTLDAMGNRTQEDTKDPSNAIAKTRSRVFDALNRLQKDIGGTSPSTQITQYTYDNNGNLKTITDPLNHVTTNGYDALNRLITVTDPANNTATTAYNALDQVTSVTDPRSLVTQYTNDALGNVTQTQSPDTGTTTNVYDAAGNITQKTDARSVVTSYTYDALNRVTSITYPANTAENVSFTYDSTANGNYGKGKLTGYSNDGGATVLVYDAYGNLTQQTEMIGAQFYVTAFQYDSANRLQQFTYPSGRLVTYTRNTLGQITQVQTQDNALAAAVTIANSITYKPLGPLSGIVFGNGVATTLQYDADYRVSRTTTTSTPQWDYVYGYDAAGNITGLIDQVSTYNKSYGYDNLDRLTSDSNNAGLYSYQYDANGNRPQRSITIGGTTTTQTQTIATTSNKLTALDGNSATVDAAGNLTALGIKGYGYNNANRLISYSESGTTKATYNYNALGKRTQKISTLTSHYRYAPDGKVLGIIIYNGDGTPNQESEYLWLDDTPIAQVQSTYTGGSVSSRRTTFIHADHLNTPRALTDSTKNIVWRWDGDAYGATLPNQNPDGDGVSDTLALRMPGQIYDEESNTSDNGFRTYSPSLGGYATQADPLGLKGGSWSLRGYALQSPLMYFDKTGLSSCGYFDTTLTCACKTPTPVAQQSCRAAGGLPLFPNLLNEEAKPENGCPPVPPGLVGDNPQDSSGKRKNSDGLSSAAGGTGNAEKDFEKLTGGTGKVDPETGYSVGENGIQYRPGNGKSGPRIDIPANGSKPPETLHYPK